MFIIKNINIGRFGNKLLYYNNLVQVSKHFNHNYYSPRFAEDGIFDLSFNDKPNVTNIIDINSKFLIENKDHSFDEQFIHLEPCLGDLFFEYDSVKTTDIFKFKHSRITDSSRPINIGIHFRGTDFMAWDPKAILSTMYYIDSIDTVLKDNTDINCKLFTDDASLQSYNDVKAYLQQNYINHELGKIDSLQDDFISLSYCDYIISSPSTFAIAAGFCGKPNKKIIHSKEWVDYQCDKGDRFWIGFNNGGNSNYSKYQII